MKKIITVFVASLVTVGMLGVMAYGATPKKTKPAAKPAAAAAAVAAAYKDGTYDVVQKSIKPGYEEAVVTIKGGKIAGIVLKRLDDKKVEINYAQWNGKGRFPNLQQARLDLAKAMVAKQSSKVDTVSGATDSSNGWISTVNAALAKAKK